MSVNECWRFIFVEEAGKKPTKSGIAFYPKRFVVYYAKEIQGKC